jgi:anti-anti-sigma regulatory factor
VKTFRTGRLEVKLRGSRAVFAGRLDDAVQLGELVSQLPPGDVVIDAAGVTFVNSVGMREWIRLIRALRDRGPITLEAVSEVLITQMNQISQFRGVRILSFYATYACASCGCESSQLIDAVAQAAVLRQMQVPKPPCPECRAAMELGDYPERYLSILRDGDASGERRD